MGLIDKVKKPLENYISFEDLICQLSQTNNEPLYSVVSYLVHFDIKSVGHYYIFADYKITPENAPWRIEGYLEEIQKILFMHNEEWIYEGAKSFEWLSDDFTRSKLLAHIRICPYYFFKKTELLLFPPLMEDELISFKNIDIPNTPLNDALKNDYLKLLGENHIGKADHASNTEELSDNTANDYQVTIGLLLELLQRKPKGFSKDGKSLPALFPSQAKIIEAIAEQVVPSQGASKIETRFGLANKAILEAKKNRPRPIDE